MVDKKGTFSRGPILGVTMVSLDNPGLLQELFSNHNKGLKTTIEFYISRINIDCIFLG